MNDRRTEQIKFVLSAIAEDEWSMDILRAARTLDLSDWAIGAGFVRNRVWDRICGKSPRTLPGDIDVLYFDQSDVSEAREQGCEARLRALIPNLTWSVTNQARMHLDNGDAPYRSTEHALSFWLETPTCVAVNLNSDDRLRLIAPHGLDDLLALIVRPTPRGWARFADYERRINAKRWDLLWPGIRIMPSGGRGDSFLS